MVETVAPPEASQGRPAKRPLFVLLDGTWAEGRKMFRRSAYLAQLPVLSPVLARSTQYRLRQSGRDDHLCTSEVASLCMELAGDALAAQILDAYLAVFTHHYLQAKNQSPIDAQGEAHRRLRALSALRA